MKTTNDIKGIVTAWQYGRMGDDDAMHMIEEILRRDGIIEDHPEDQEKWNKAARIVRQLVMRPESPSDIDGYYDLIADEKQMVRIIYSIL